MPYFDPKHKECSGYLLKMFTCGIKFVMLYVQTENDLILIIVTHLNMLRLITIAT